ncbi:MAG: ferritin-like domain-containing protein [Variovorax sp.]|jgi:rubrerythrin|nr:ferritin-like domain-containing protein [Variovorax sp.]
MPAHEAARWEAEDLDFSRIVLGDVHEDENLFYLISCASFIESGSDLYTHNLIDFFRGDTEVADWLRDRWEPEELKHGRALRAYVQHVWPEFAWQPAFDAFLHEYATYCKVELLAPTRALELAARCVVETGTATYYSALAHSTNEPLLHELAERIAADEVSHYKNFYRFFKRYRAQEAPGRARVLATVGRRTLELKSEDADCAIRHVARSHAPERAEDSAYLQQISARMNATIRRNLRPGTTLKMLMRPLALPPALQAIVQWPVEQFMQRVFLR